MSYQFSVDTEGEWYNTTIMLYTLVGSALSIGLALVMASGVI
ncbi:hypothetical protein [Halomontanus rarus]|nr:hypothetical protein [Halovivax sp. TS33]